VYALAKYAEKDYERAIEIFHEILLTSQNERENESCNYFLGMSYLKMTLYENALKYFSYSFKDSGYKNDALAFLGVCQMAMGHIDGIHTLEEAIKTETNTHAYHNALLNLAANINDDEKALSLYQKLFNSTLISEYSDKEELNRLTVLSLYYQAEILEKTLKSIALEKIELALEYCNINDSIFLLYFKYNLQDKKDDTIKELIANKIIENKLTFEKEEQYPISFTERHVYYYLDFVFGVNSNSLFERLLDYIVVNLILDKSRYEIIYRTSYISSVEEQILSYLVSLDNEKIDNVVLLAAYRGLLLANTNTNQSFLKLFDNYLELFKNTNEVLNTDIYVFAYCIKLLSDKKDYIKGLTLCEILLERIDRQQNHDLKFESIIIYYWYSNLYFSRQDRSNALLYADIALGLINDSNGKHTSMIDEAGLKSISNQLDQIKISSIITKPILGSKKIGRNDKIKVRYLSGEVKEDKYKKLEADLLAKRCEII
jgi:hypothetical protein